MKKTIKDIDITNKKVIIRVDYNVPIKDGKIVDDNRIVMSLETINYAIEKGAKIILLSHLGRIKSLEDKDKNSLKIVAQRLQELVDTKVTFVGVTKGLELEQAIDNMNFGEIVLVENTRYEDYPDKLESGNDSELGKYWASLGDVFINDAFATAHRSHASNVGIASNLESGIGFLIEKEVSIINDILSTPKHPLIVIMGGSKVSDKIGLISNIITKCDQIIIGGAMAFTFLKAMNKKVGISLVEDDKIEYCQSLLKEYGDKILLPKTVVVDTAINDLNVRTCSVDEIQDNEMGLDIVVSDEMKAALINSKQVIWNGPVGYSEISAYENGTKQICNILKESGSSVFVGGGDTGASLKKLGYQDDFYVSTGGGASLEMLEGKELPGVSIIGDK